MNTHDDHPRRQPDPDTAGESASTTPFRHSVEETDRPETPDLEGLTPMEEELTGRASGTDEDLNALFDNGTPAHLTDGFRGGSADDPEMLDEDELQDGNPPPV
jgi:hypothetical protein